MPTFTASNGCLILYRNDKDTIIVGIPYWVGRLKYFELFSDSPLDHTNIFYKQIKLHKI